VAVLVEVLDRGSGPVDIGEDGTETVDGAVEVPGTKECTSMMLLPSAVNSR
jgi:hypothetical protein